MSFLFTPAYRLTIGGKVVDTTAEPQASTLVDLTVTVDLDVPADSFMLLLGQVGTFEPARDDEATIALGYADNGGLTQVMTGTVMTVEPGLTTARIIGHSTLAKILRTFVDQTYENKTVAQIVRDLAGKAEVDVATAEEGITFPAYVVDGQRDVYRHMRDLADLSGFDLYVNPEGELVCEKFVGGKVVHVLEYTKHILKLDGLQTPQRAALVEAWGESPGSSRGDESWAWLTKDFTGSRGAAGSGDPKLLLERPALRTADTARTAAQAALTAIQRRTLRGRLLTIGRPEVKLGDAIRLRNVPRAALNSTFQVRSVTHRISKVGGFTTAIEFRSIA